VCGSWRVPTATERAGSNEIPAAAAGQLDPPFAALLDRSVRL
jgi:hypothetical protein